MHRTTDRFWKCLEKLPEPIQRISKKNFELLKSTLLIHPSISKRLASFGQPGLESTTGRLRSRMVRTSYGSGLEHMMNMKE